MLTYQPDIRETKLNISSICVSFGGRKKWQDITIIIFLKHILPFIAKNKLDELIAVVSTYVDQLLYVFFSSKPSEWCR